MLLIRKNTPKIYIFFSFFYNCTIFLIFSRLIYQYNYNTMEGFGKKLVDLRKQKGISQEQLAIDLNISQSSISNYELGVTKPDVDILKKICDYFNVPIAYMFSDEKLIFHTVENHGGNSGYMINSTLNIYADKLIELYELRLKEKEELISFLKKEIERFTISN